MLEEASRRTDADLCAMDVSQLAFREAVFDIALLSHCLLHLPRPELGLAKTARVVRLGGHLGVSSFKADARQRSRATTMIDELLDQWGADKPAPMPSYESDGFDEKKLAEMARRVGLKPLRAWTKHFQFRAEKSGEEILGLRASRIGSLPHDKAVEFTRQATSLLSELLHEFERTSLYLVAQR